MMQRVVVRTRSSEKYDMPAGTEGRYVRITVNGNTENNWASITEIAVFGSGSAPIRQVQIIHLLLIPNL